MNAINQAESASLVSEPLRIQPVLDAKGVVREMALVGGHSRLTSALLANAASADALRRAGRIFRAAGCMATLSMDHPLNVHSDILLPQQLCQDLRIGAVAGDQLRDTLQEAQLSQPIYPCAKVTYNVPLSDRLAQGATRNCSLRYACGCCPRRKFHSAHFAPRACGWASRKASVPAARCKSASSACWGKRHAKA